MLLLLFEFVRVHYEFRFSKPNANQDVEELPEIKITMNVQILTDIHLKRKNLLHIHVIQSMTRRPVVVTEVSY